MTRPIASVSLVFGAGIAALLAAAPAQAKERKVAISPYIEIGQVVTADLQTDDVLTYSTVAAGVSAIGRNAPRASAGELPLRTALFIQQARRRRRCA